MNRKKTVTSGKPIKAVYVSYVQVYILCTNNGSEKIMNRKSTATSGKLINLLVPELLFF